MVQTEIWRPSGAHIFSEKVASFGLVSLEVAKKRAQKYKKNDTKMMLCTVSRFPPIYTISACASRKLFPALVLLTSFLNQTFLQ